MSTPTESTDPIQIPTLPSGSVKNFIPYFAKSSNTPVGTLLEPFKAFEAELRKVYAREPTHEVVQDGTVNLVPIFDGHEHELKIRARSLDIETDDEKSRYIMSLSDEDRKPDGVPAVVPSFKEFQKNFNLFSESSLTDLDWNNVVAAGSAVTTSLLPIPEKHAASKKTMREYYHRNLAPASDVDLFLYGLNEEEGLEKIKQIERSIKDSILQEVTVIRTKNAITIASQYPTRHVQIVLRLYDSISQIITGFDVDCACAAYDGTQVYAAPRAIAAFVTQTNTIDLTRRSPSYENRLSKYSHRGFEVHWPLLDRTRIDPTIFERSFGRTQGLARLLILEKLPKTADRDSYMDQRRLERGRPTIHRGYRNQYRSGGNIKDWEEDEVAEWVDQEEVASYHTMTVPYGEKYHAAKINRLLYAKDLLLNAEWNQPDDRKVYLHRHPCFFGTAEEVLQDCCGYCPTPKTDEEIDIAKEEKKTYISGKLVFIKDDPGRQEIGSFNPITDDEWTTMAYVGDTARLCQAIVDGDLEHVQDWCSQEGVDVNRRDYTGRTPLHLATMASTPEIVQCLINSGARLIARLVDGKTALHIAAARGNSEMVKALMDKSLENEEEENEKQDARRAARRSGNIVLSGDDKGDVDDDNEDASDSESEASEITLESEEGSDSMTMGSFVKVDTEKKSEEDGVPDDSLEEPDFYDVNVIAWDYGLSPLHLAIINGHLDIIKLLVSEYGADVLVPVKLMEVGSNNPKGAIMSILLALSLPTEKAKEVVKLLLELGASSAQADMNRFTALHYVVAHGSEDVLDLLLANDRPIALSVLNNVGSRQWDNQGNTPLTTAISNGSQSMVSKLLALGAKPTVPFEDWVKTYLSKNVYAKNQTAEVTKSQYNSSVSQPVIAAATKSMAESVKELLAHGADPLTLERTAYNVIQNPYTASYQTPETLIDIIQGKLKVLREYKIPELEESTKPEKLRDESHYTSGLEKGSYQYWSAVEDFRAKKRANQKLWIEWDKTNAEKSSDGVEQKQAAIEKLIRELEDAEKSLTAAGAKPFYELYPDTPKSNRNNSSSYNIKTEPVPYETKFQFHIPDLDDIKKDGYFKLYEAAWNNDLETVKGMTLAPWKLDSSDVLHAPLKIAVQDGNGFSPFSIAVLRGHYDLARKCVEVCIAQYHEDDGLSSRQRWTMRNSELHDEERSDYDSENEEESENEDALPIFSELVSDKFTVDNLGEVSNVVKSDTLPLTMISWPCFPQRITEEVLDKEEETSRFTLLCYAVQTDNMVQLKFIIELGEEQTALRAKHDDDQKCFTVDRSVFYEAIKLGRTAILAEMIKRTGVGIPLNELIKTSGVELKTKPKHYQGLSVGGKKRADWAQAPGGNTHIIEERIPPLLQAAHLGSIDSVEWFMSDAPMRRYKEFAERNKHDKRIKTLEEVGTGFQATIGKWLGTKSELILHSAVLYNPGEKETDISNHYSLLKHILAAQPETLEQKSSEGWTPLHVAMFMENSDLVSFLLQQGANQRHRDKASRNIIHNMLVHLNPTFDPTSIYRSTNSACFNLDKMEKMLVLFDKQAVKEMLLERCTLSPGALTPLAYWMSRNLSTHKKPDVISLLSTYSTGEDLEMINGEGDLPLHVAIKQCLSSITAFLLSLNPSLLYRENATGRTPLEMARDMVVASNVEDHPNLKQSNYNSYYSGHHNASSIDILSKAAKEFMEPTPDPEESKKRTWEVCDEVDRELINAGSEKRKRRLVSLFEANEVAKRVASLKAKNVGRQVVVNGGVVSDEGKPDVISEWLN